MPPSRKPLPPPRRVDWNTEDVKLAAAVKVVALKIRALPGRPVRVSKASIIRGVNHRPWIEQHLNKLPLTAKALAKHLEIPEDFLIRRVEWAENSYREECICPTQLQLTIRAGTRTKTGRLERVQRTIDDAMRRLTP